MAEMRLEAIALLFLVHLRKVLILNLQQHFTKRRRVAHVHLAVRQQALK
jgi:hypothetical protein